MLDLRATAAAVALALSVGGLAALPRSPALAAPAPGDATPRPDDRPVATSPVDVANPCDRTVVPPPGADGTTCMLPFPNNLFTQGTGADRRLNLPLAGMPKNAAGKPISPLPYGDSDGYSPGQLIVVKVPGLDNPEALARTNAVSITDMARYTEPAAPVVVFDVQTGRRHPIYVEIDVNPLGPLPQGSAAGLVTGEAADQTDQDPPPTPTTGPPRPSNTANVNLLIRPSRNFVEGHRYVVALRNLKDATGATLKATEGFTTYRDRTALSELDPRTERYEKDVFPVIESAGIARSSLYQAWDFSIASKANITGRLLSMRDDAFSQLGDDTLADRVVQGRAPEFTANASTMDDQGVRTVTGTFTVPCYINTARCAPGGEFVYGPEGRMKPLQLPGNVTVANYTCKIPRRVYDSPTLEKLRPSIYGHGLLGGQGEVGQGQVKNMIAEHGFVYCAADWEGFATQDIGTVAQALADMDRFPAVIDHTEQGELNFLYLSRLMIHPQGLSSSPSFQVDKGAGPQSFLDTTRGYYDGNSQGGIYGGTVMAITPDIDRGVLGVPGINYSTLLTRSTDFALYSLPLYTAYPSEYERPLLFSVIQILWDRGDPNGYVSSLAPGQELPRTPPHEVLYQVGFGDHQVANVSAETAARTMGAAVDARSLEPGRSPDVTPLWDVSRIAAYPHRGSGFVYFDIGPFDPVTGKGTPPAPITNTPQSVGEDPHEAPRNSACARVMKSNFLRPDGVVTNPCQGAPYFAFDYHGRDGQPGQGDTVQPGDAAPYPTPVRPSPTATPTATTAGPGPVPAGPAPADPGPTPTANASSASASPPGASPAGTPGPSPAVLRTSGGFHALSPTRLLDTRAQGGAVAAGSDRTVQVAGRAGVPATGVSAVVVNATVTGATRQLDLAVHPAGSAPAERTSNLNVASGSTVANLVTGALSADGRLTLSVSAGRGHVVLDVLGWYDDGTGPAGSGYVPTPPVRRFDSREAQPVAAGTDRVVDLLSPRPAGVNFAVVTITALGARVPADVSLSPTGRTGARTSTLNLRPGQTVANTAVVPVDAQGRVAVSVSAGSVHVVLDLLGWYDADSARTLSTGAPRRLLDTRRDGGTVTAGSDRRVPVLGLAGVPATGVDAVLVNVTSTRSTANADLQVFPTGERPARRTSNLNVRRGQDVAVLVLATVGADGSISLSGSQGRMDVVLDVLGWVRSG